MITKHREVWTATVSSKDSRTKYRSRDWVVGCTPEGSLVHNITRLYRPTNTVDLIAELLVAPYGWWDFLYPYVSPNTWRIICQTCTAKCAELIDTDERNLRVLKLSAFGPKRLQQAQLLTLLTSSDSRIVRTENYVLGTDRHYSITSCWYSWQSTRKRLLSHDREQWYDKKETLRWILSQGNLSRAIESNMITVLLEWRTNTYTTGRHSILAQSHGICHVNSLIDDHNGGIIRIRHLIEIWCIVSININR